MAPLRGVTVAEFRLCHEKRFGGIDYAVAPFIPLVSRLKAPEKLIKDVLPENCGRVRTVPQVIGREPAQLTAMAEALRDAGHTELNLNCGCPWKFVAKKGRGSGLPENEAVFAAMMEAGCNAMPDGFSIKIRLGRNTSDTLTNRLDLINRFPLREVIIHPRTGIQMYGGEVDMRAFEELIHRFNAPVVYNGDINSVEDYVRLVTRFPGLPGVMIGRGLASDPFLANDIKAWEATGRGSVPTLPHSRERMSEVAEFAAELYERYRSTLFGPSPVLGRMKELWGYLYKYFENSGRLLREVQRSSSFAEYEQALSRNLKV